ncbi:transcription factor kayak isoform X2 [Sitodiplosis mosellana]|uniref:transcription factor kayak isoform X2 n=2 Tax=Sitodiplosis mosellana TaxID=263140 RepID=UPI002443882F|nr:transcription factor kayak isoform X2 [Sitodiplosis mosellana]
MDRLITICTCEIEEEQMIKMKNIISTLFPVSKMLVSLDGIHSGVPTRTTSTLTPTTLRNIEQTFLELTNDTSNTVPCQAGFVPPPLPNFQFEPESQEHSLGSSDSNSSESWHTSPPNQETSFETNFSEIASVKGNISKRNMGGRRPKNSANLSPEEEEKRRVRRERNKLAAARCRKRRVDQTNELLEKVLILESEKNKLQRDIQDLQAEKEDLECLLQSHRSQCKLQIGGFTKVVELKSKIEFKEPIRMPLIGKIKVEVDDSAYEEVPSPTKHLISGANPVIGAIANPTINSAIPGTSKPIARPSSLNVPFTAPPSQTIGLHKNIADMAGVQITTPSNVVAFNFDSLMDGGTGLTPVAMPSCPSQNKSPLDLATPTSEPSKSLVSL